MKLIRFGEPGREKPGLQLEDGARVDASAFGADYDEAFFGGGGLARLREWSACPCRPCPRLPPAPGWGRPSRAPARSSASALNYRDHAAETGLGDPEGARHLLQGDVLPRRPRRRPRHPARREEGRLEVELAVVIGARASYVTKEDAPRHIAGYALHNDYSERSFQLEHGGQWSKARARHLRAAGAVPRPPPTRSPTRRPSPCG